jgi:hypothetical protein
LAYTSAPAGGEALPSLGCPPLPKIFINYRRGDDPSNTGRLFDRLQEVFASDQLFMDVDNIAPGLDFVRVLEEQMGQWRCSS